MIIYLYFVSIYVYMTKYLHVFNTPKVNWQKTEVCLLSSEKCQIFPVWFQVVPGLSMALKKLFVHKTVT